MGNPGERTSTKEEVTTQEIYLQEADDQPGPVDADITHLAEQRAMQVVLRYQMLSVERITQTSPHTAEPPTAPPVSLYASAMTLITSVGNWPDGLRHFLHSLNQPRALTHMQTA